MIKICDHNAHYKKRWEGDFLTFEAACAEAENRLEAYYCEDRDNGHTYFIEVYNNGEITVFVGDYGSWLYCPNNLSPDRWDFHGTREQIKAEYGDWFRPIERNPRVDYLDI